MYVWQICVTNCVHNMLKIANDMSLTLDKYTNDVQWEVWHVWWSEGSIFMKRQVDISPTHTECHVCWFCGRIGWKEGARTKSSWWCSILFRMIESVRKAGFCLMFFTLNWISMTPQETNWWHRVRWQCASFSVHSVLAQTYLSNRKYI